MPPANGNPSADRWMASCAEWFGYVCAYRETDARVYAMYTIPVNATTGRRFRRNSSALSACRTEHDWVGDKERHLSMLAMLSCRKGASVCCITMLEFTVGVPSLFLTCL